MAGHSGKGFWFSTGTGDFQTGAYYNDAYPARVGKWNERRKAEAYSGQCWTLSGNPDG